MKHRLILRLTVIVFSIALFQSAPACADSYYKINKRAYRKMVMNSVRHNYPSPFAQRFWRFMDNSVLQQDGPLDSLVERLLRTIAAAEEANSAALTAKRSVTPNPQLTSILEQTRQINASLGIVVPDSPVSPPTDKDFSNFNSPVNFPAGVTP